MEYIGRLFKHVWPQWHRLIIVFTCSLLIGVFFCLNIATVIPLLKVLMSKEGFHGYVERKICSSRYGIKFQLPELAHTAGDNSNISLEDPLLINSLDDKGQGKLAGLKEGDYIIRITMHADEAALESVTASQQLISTLAWAPEANDVTLQYRRHQKDESVLNSVTINTGKHPWYFATVKKLMSYVPAHQGSNAMLKGIIFVIVLLLIATVGRSVALFAQKYTASKVTQTVMAKLRGRIFSHAIKLPISYFSEQQPSDAVSRLSGDTAIISVGVKIILGKTLREPIKAIMLIGCAMFLDVRLTLIYMLAAPAIAVAIGGLGKRIRKATKKSLISRSSMLGKLTETLRSVKVIKVYNQSSYEEGSFDHINTRLLKQSLRISKIDSATSPIMEILGIFAGSLALYVGARSVAQGSLDPTEFLTFLFFLGGAAESVRKSSDIWNRIQQANAAGERIYGLLDEPIETDEPDAIELEAVRDKIEFRNVIFTYPCSKKPILNGIDIKIQAGHNVAIVGPNGSGKTTLVNLLPRFYNVDSGKILIDGLDIKNVTLNSLRDKISLVTQNVLAFNDTIAANIAYGRRNATREQIVEAAKRAFAHEFISKMPDGYDTMIGENSTGLSGGQLQRIVIARAIIKDPPILIFDEATSQIDADSEAKIHAALEDLTKQRTSLIIAHRFSTVIGADSIVVMDNGKIVAQGSHDELINKCSLYQSLYENQLIKD